MKKTIFAMLVFMALISAIFAYSAEEDSEDIRGPFKIRLIENCGLEDFTEEECESWQEVVVGFPYEFKLKEDRSARLTHKVFPISEIEGSPSVYSQNEIFCDNPDAIAVAKFDIETKKWTALETSHILEEGTEIGMYKVEADITEEGIYAVVMLDNAYVTAPDGSPACGRRACGIYKGFEVKDHPDGNVPQGEPAQLDFCRILMGCDAAAAVGTPGARACPPGANANNPKTCTGDETDCCLPVRDNQCDPDCWKIDIEGNVVVGSPDDDTALRDSTDPDCLVPGAELYTEPLYEDETNKQDIMSKTITRSSWEWEYSDSYDIPKLFDGPISFEVKGDGVLFFRNFTYTDLNDEEHLLFPLYPTGHPTSRNWFNSPLSEINSLRREGVFYPHQWFQREGYGEVVQFDIPPTGIKRFAVQAALRTEDKSKRTTFTIRGYSQEDADPDNDGFSNYDDCHDNNPNIYPGAAELCNGLDDDCDSYNKYNYSEVTSTEPYRWIVEGTGSECDIAGDMVWHHDFHYRMPADGQIEWIRVAEPLYFELWKKENCSLYGYSCPGPDCPKFTGKRSQISCDGAGFNGQWNIHQVLLAAGSEADDEAGFGCCYEKDGDDEECNRWGCIIGAHASCKIGAMPDIQADFGHGMCPGTYYQGEGEWLRMYDSTHNPQLTSGYLSTGTGDDNYVSFREGSKLRYMELKEGEVIWAKVFAEGEGKNTCGDVRFKIHTYKKSVWNEWKKEETVDEGADCAEKLPMKVFVCPEPEFEEYDIFDSDNERCIDEEICSFITTTESTEIGTSPADTLSMETEQAIAQCVYDTTDDEPGIKQFHAFACRDGYCFKFYEGSFRVCLEKEQCSGITNPELNIDTDCDELEPFELTDGRVDITRPKDPDCIDVDITGECDFIEKKWYESEEHGWVEDGYCQQCGDRDSSCTKLCEENEKSCDGGCRADACDISANKWCRNGAWTESGYAAKCGLKDADFFTEAGRDCTGNACDLVYNKTCYSSNWMPARRDVPYCETPTCRGIDFDCGRACTAGSCDVHANAYCKADSAWSIKDAPDYCSQCGAFDADCGGKACEPDTCDTNAHKVCLASGEWEGEQLKYCEKCELSDIYYCNPECPPEEEQVPEEGDLCLDGIDNDCDGDADCMDDKCSEMPECEDRCIPGATDSCGLDEGLCTPGTRICGFDGKWGECEGAVLPQPEVCNGWDDDCTGAADEGCECTNGESRVCGRDSGQCASGIQRCADGRWSICYKSSRAMPTEEICDTLDNDCDGEVDEGCPCVDGTTQSCGITEGVCKQGVQTCSGGEWGKCEGEKGKFDENTNIPGACSDTFDNDCDGKTDADDDGCTVTRTEDLAPSCTDHIKNQDEEDIDCGGICAPCVTPANCNNRIMDPGEDGLDCGGECSVQCTERTRAREGPSTEIEEDTEIIAECGDYICDAGEEDACPEDCDEEKEPVSLTGFLLPIIIVLGVLALGYFAYKKGLIKLKGKKPEKAAPAFPTPKAAKEAVKPSMQFRQPQYMQQKASPKKQFKTKEELELEKSLKEQKELLKK